MNPKKLPKFLIADNEMASSRLFIVHTRTPRFIAEAFHFGIDEESEWLATKKKFNQGASVDWPSELITLGVVWMEGNDLDPDRVAKLMSRMGDWYYSWLKFQK